jgi:hypothetical protein
LDLLNRTKKNADFIYVWESIACDCSCQWGLFIPDTLLSEDGPDASWLALYYLIILIFKKTPARQLLGPIMEPAFQGKIFLADVHGILPVLSADKFLHHLRMAPGKFLQGVDPVIVKAFQIFG